MTLPPTRAFLLWSDGAIPSGRTVAVLPLEPKSEYRWKVRTRFHDASVSQWSALQTFSTGIDSKDAPWLQPSQ